MLLELLEVRVVVAGRLEADALGLRRDPLHALGISRPPCPAPLHGVVRKEIEAGLEIPGRDGGMRRLRRMRARKAEYGPGIGECRGALCEHGSQRRDGDEKRCQKFFHGGFQRLLERELWFYLTVRIRDWLFTLIAIRGKRTGVNLSRPITSVMSYSVRVAAPRTGK